MSTQCIIVNMGQPLLPDLHGNEHIIPEIKRPGYVHDDLESAQTEALRLHKKYAGPQGRFVIFQAVEQTVWRNQWVIATPTVAALEPIETPAATIPERTPKKKRRKQA